MFWEGELDRRPESPRACGKVKKVGEVVDGLAGEEQGAVERGSDVLVTVV